MTPTRRTRRHRRRLLLVALGASLGGLGAEGGCLGDDLIQDPTFDLWCGETLCDWEVEEGVVERVPTWHPADDGVGLLGDPTVISQRVDATSGEVDCIRFELVADVDDGVGLTLEMDFYDDGVAEYSHPLISDDYQQVAYDITPPTTWKGVRFRLRKTGSGQAVLAQIRARSRPAEECPDPPLDVEAPLGEQCDDSVPCHDATCAEVPVVSSADPGLTVGICSECDADADCGADEVCGVTWGDDLFGWRECRPPSTRLLGEACASDGECESGTCCQGQCSECCSNADCPETRECRRHQFGEGTAPAEVMPFVCDAPGGDRAVGESCLADRDCAEGSCEGDGQIRICDPDGRPCASDADCPWVELGGRCVTIGPAHGTCD
ncbi:MAG: hypothetical protein D6798_08540 [Deltaproteobacteria bacterium]|nr:MAG: hypothetical protein D6798_08540 [Deltaproteobacteria bacterium]